jgi:DNA-binding beta-propeller fold protein YncE
MTRAYVAGGAGVSLYSANSGSGELTFVQNYSTGDASGIALNPAGTLAYVVLSNDTVLLCAIDGASGGLITPCTSTGSEFDGAQRITLNSIGTFAYVTNIGSQNITVCSVDSSSGNLSNCSRTAEGVFDGFANMAVNWSNTKAYVPNSGSDLVSLCSINANGTLSGCTNSGGTNFNGPKGVALG